MVERYRVEIREEELTYETFQYQMTEYIDKSDFDTEYELISVKEVYDSFKNHPNNYNNNMFADNLKKESETSLEIIATVPLDEAKHHVSSKENSFTVTNDSIVTLYKWLQVDNPKSFEMMKYKYFSAVCPVFQLSYYLYYKICIDYEHKLWSNYFYGHSKWIPTLFFCFDGALCARSRSKSSVYCCCN